MKIPYGISDFAQIRGEGYFYADKTPLLPALEGLYRHVVFLRPRRFGKSTLLSMLERYYDIRYAQQFDSLFRGLWIHEHPTSERSSYLVLSLDFASVATDRGQEAMLRTFLAAVRGGVRSLIAAHRGRAPELSRIEERLDGFLDPEALVTEVLGAVERAGQRLYVLVDEYDHFANRLLSSGAEDLYETIVRKTGFVRTFYAALKSGTGTGAVGRMFVTGVSPLMLDDLSSGFNIATHASMDRALATLAGLTHSDVERAVDEFLAARPEVANQGGLFERGALVAALAEHYDGYRFSPRSEERVFNSDMVLHFLSHIDRSGSYPDSMLDRNVRTEYGHLQRIGTLSGADADERRDLLLTIAGEGRLRSEIVEQFGVRSLSSRTPFVSLLYFLGMLTLGAAPRTAAGYDLEVPNRVIRELQWEHLALLLRDDARVRLDVDDLRLALTKMAEEGDIDPFLSLFHEQVVKAFSVRDTRGLDEKTLKLLLMTYASLGKAFHPLSEKELAQGYGDLFLAAGRHVVGARYSWLLELKYLKTGAKPAQIEAAFEEAEGQVERYAGDRALLPLLLGDRQLKAGMIVFVGAKRVLFRAWEPKKKERRPRSESAVARRGRGVK